jgi:hypothetical protein
MRAMLILLLFLIACAKPEVIAKPNITTTEPVLNVTVIEEVQEIPEEVVTQPVTPADETITEEPVNETIPQTKLGGYLETFAQTVQSYQFDYQQKTYRVRGSNIKITLDTPIYERSATSVDGKSYPYIWLDAIYLDRKEKSAVGYCEGLTETVKEKCRQFELADVVFPRLFGDYLIPLPEDWLFTFLNYVPSEIQLHKTAIDRRIVDFLRFDVEGKTTELSIDPRIGLPLTVVIKQGEAVLEKHPYEKLVVNHVREGDVTHHEVASEDVFYDR